MKQYEICAVRKNTDGNLISFKLNDGQILDYEQAVSMAQKGQIKNIDVIDRKSGKKILRSEPDGISENNLSNLPQF